MKDYYTYYLDKASEGCFNKWRSYVWRKERSRSLDYGTGKLFERWEFCSRINNKWTTYHPSNNRIKSFINLTKEEAFIELL